MPARDCPCTTNSVECLSCKSELGSGSGARAIVNGRVTSPYKPDPMRDRSLRYNGGGYLRQGYDSDRPIRRR